MRKIAAIFFLTVLVLVQTPVQQFLKLPVLIAHFNEHRAENAGISFLEYIQLHYFSGNPKDDDTSAITSCLSARLRSSCCCRPWRYPNK